MFPLPDVCANTLEGVKAIAPAAIDVLSEMNLRRENLVCVIKNFLKVGGFKDEVQHGLTIDETPLRVFSIPIVYEGGYSTGYQSF
jgi:hypothetical protein